MSSTTDTIATTSSLDPPRFRAIRTIFALILREMGSTYGASPGGYIWAILQPVGMLVILSVAFSLVVRAPSLGTSFILFYATGYLPFNLYQDIQIKVSATMRYARALLAYPAVTWADAVLARFILNVVTNSVIFCIVIGAILFSIDTLTVLRAGPILTALALAALCGFGLGVCNAIFAGLYPVWLNLWKIISRPMFLASGVLFIYEDLPTLAQDILWWNPLMHVTGLMRAGFYPTYHPQYISLPYAFGLPMVLTVIGLIFLRAYHNRVLER